MRLSISLGAKQVVVEVLEARSGVIDSQAWHSWFWRTTTLPAFSTSSTCSTLVSNAVCLFHPRELGAALLIEFYVYKVVSRFLSALVTWVISFEIGVVEETEEGCSSKENIQ